MKKKKKNPQKPKDEEQYMSDKTPRLKLVSSLVIPARLQTRSTREGRSEVMWVGGCVCVVLDCKKRQFARRDQSCIKSPKEAVWNPKANFCLVLNCKRRRSEFGTPKKNFCFVLSCKRRKSEFGTRSDLSSCDKSAKEETNCFFQIKGKGEVLCAVLLLLL